MNTAVAPADRACSAETPRLLARLRGLMARVAGDAMFRQSLLSIADQAIVSATNFAITVILGRLCGKPELGLYYLPLQAVVFARSLQEQLIASPYLVYGARKSPQESSRYAGSTLVHELILLVGVSLVFAAAAAFAGLSPELSDLLWLLVAAAPLLLLREFIRQFSFAQLRVSQALTLDAGVSLLQLAGLVAAAYAGVLTTSLTYTLLAIGCGIPAIAWVVLRRGTFAPDSRSLWPDWVHNWRFGRWALASLLLGQTVPLALPWIVAGIAGQSGAAAYGVSATLIGFANMYVLGLSNFICPRAAKAYAKGGTRDLAAVLQHATVMYVSTLFPFALAMLLAGQSPMTLIYGPAFAEAGPIMAVLAVGAVANSLGVVAGNGLWAMELPSANFRADVCALVVWVLATAWLVPLYGPLGAAIASAAGTTIGAIVRGGSLHREMAMRRQPA
jgi:O-antigen/teichoic acid export membrane protein